VIGIIGHDHLREGRMSEEYREWHTGVEFDRESRTWRGYIENNDYSEKRLTEETFDHKEDAAVAASDMLTAARRSVGGG
jgi:hypothetical protein